MDTKTPTQILIEKWPSKRSLVDDINAISGADLKSVAVIRWHNRSSIPSKYDAAIVASAAKRALSVSLVDLMNARSVHIDQLGNSSRGVQGRGSENSGAVT